MPVYNAAEYLRGALDSLLAQTLVDFELIISDNASDDGTSEICEDYAARDKRVICHRQAHNIGAIANFQFVLDQARGEFFMWAAHDDLWDPNLLQELSSGLVRHPEASLSVYRTVRIDVDGCELDSRRYPDADGRSVPRKLASLLEAAEKGTWFYGLYRKDDLRPVWSRYSNLGQTWGSDYLMIVHFLLNDRIVGTNATTFYQRITGASENSYAPRTLIENAKFLRTMLAWCRRIARDCEPRKRGSLSTLQAGILFVRCAGYFARLAVSRTGLGLHLLRARRSSATS
jgi:glycosyltransferase involved in cell wall biosynthesis